jgi:penicillin V acylase-like amidase (Ntn superfamily)
MSEIGRPVLYPSLMKILILILSLAVTQTAYPCSAFLFSRQGDHYLARGLDWDYDHGYVMINPRRLEKKALISLPNTPATWTAKYGSATFNHVARELPLGGMNEKGLVVEALWLRSAKFPIPNAQPTLNELQWLQAVECGLRSWQETNSF